MARKRKGLNEPMKENLQTSPQARRGFTQADQVNQLVSAREADPDLGFMARMMALCCLPRTNPGNRKEYVRAQRPVQTRDGPLESTTNSPSATCRACCWLGFARRRYGTRKRELVLGRSLSKFMRTLGVYSSAGGVATRLRNQMDRLFNAHIQLIYEDKRSKATVNALIATPHGILVDHPQAR